MVPAAASLQAAALAAALVLAAVGSGASASRNLRVSVPTVVVPPAAADAASPARRDAAASPAFAPSKSLVLPAVAGDMLALRFGWESTYNMINVHAQPSFVTGYSCSADGRTLAVGTVSDAVAAGAASWSLPLVVIVQDASCGVLDGPLDCVAGAAGCLGATCAADSDCRGTYICEASACAAQPDISFFNVSSVATSGTQLTFAGAALSTAQLDTVVTATEFEYITIAPAPASSSLTRRRAAGSSAALSRRDTTCDTLKWWFVPYGFECHSSIPQESTLKLRLVTSQYVDLEVDLTTKAQMSFNSALFSANGTGVSLVWSDWTVEADFDISGKFNLSYTYTTSIAIPDLGWSIKGSWGGASVGVYFDPTVALAANVDLALKLPVTADFHSGSVGVGTGVYDPSRFDGSALLHPTVAVGAASLTSATTASAGVELKLAVGAQVSVVGIPVVNEVSLGADLFAAARVEALLLTGSTVSAACAAKNSPVEIDGKYGYEVGVEYSIPIVSLNGKYDFWGQPGYPYDIGYYCF